MTRHFGIKSNRASLGGMSTDAVATRNAILPRDLNCFPSQSILHPQDILDPPLDIRRALVGALVGSVTGVLFAIALFVLLFVET